MIQPQALHIKSFLPNYFHPLLHTIYNFHEFLGRFHSLIASSRIRVCPGALDEGADFTISLPAAVPPPPLVAAPALSHAPPRFYFRERGVGYIRREDVLVSVFFFVVAGV